MDIDCKSLSNCALQIALHTMKDRCQQLQHRLSNLEEENLKLRIDLKKSKPIDSTHIEESSESTLLKLNKELESLAQQKSQLTHHIFMVATENKQLWTKLALLTEEKLVPEQSLNLVEDASKTDQLKEIDIAHNLDGMETCKSDITECPSMKDLEFNLSLMIVNGDENVEISEVQEHLNKTKVKLKTILSQFKNQQHMMKATLKHLIQMKKDRESAPPPLCSHCQESRKQLRDKTYKVPKCTPNEPKSDTMNLSDYSTNRGHSTGPHTPQTPQSNAVMNGNEQEIDDSSLEDFVHMESAQVCPLCEHMETGESEFLQHVYSHFGESNEEDNAPTVHSGSNTLEHGAVFPQFNI